MIFRYLVEDKVELDTAKAIQIIEWIQASKNGDNAAISHLKKLYDEIKILVDSDNEFVIAKRAADILKRFGTPEAVVQFGVFLRDTDVAREELGVTCWSVYPDLFKIAYYELNYKNTPYETLTDTLDIGKYIAKIYQNCEEAKKILLKVYDIVKRNIDNEEALKRIFHNDGKTMAGFAHVIIQFLSPDYAVINKLLNLSWDNDIIATSNSKSYSSRLFSTPIPLALKDSDKARKKKLLKLYDELVYYEETDLGDYPWKKLKALCEKTISESYDPSIKALAKTLLFRIVHLHANLERHVSLEEKENAFLFLKEAAELHQYDHAKSELAKIYDGSRKPDIPSLKKVTHKKLKSIELYESIVQQKGKSISKAAKALKNIYLDIFRHYHQKKNILEMVFDNDERAMHYYASIFKKFIDLDRDPWGLKIYEILAGKHLYLNGEYSPIPLSDISSESKEEQQSAPKVC